MALGGVDPIHSCSYPSPQSRLRTLEEPGGTGGQLWSASQEGLWVRGCGTAERVSGVGRRPAPRLCPVWCWTWQRAQSPESPPGFSTSVSGGPGLIGPLGEAGAPPPSAVFLPLVPNLTTSLCPSLPGLWLLLSPTWTPALASSPVCLPSLFPLITSFKWRPRLSLST